MSLPRAIDATKLAETRIREILTVCDQIKSSDMERYGLKGLPRSLRRRTRSHNSYKHGKRSNQAKKLRASAVSELESFTNRRMRRKKKFKQYTDPWSGTDESASYRLPTHVFHAKRMQMEKMEYSNFIVPEGAFGRGRGTRSFLHKLNSSCVVHDASYWCPIEIEGPSQDVSSLLLALSGDSYNGSLSDGREYRIIGHRVNQGSVKTRIGPIDIICTEGNGITSLLVWAHCIYSDVLVRDFKDPKGGYGHLVKSVGRLGRIEIRGPRSAEVLLDQGRVCQLDCSTVRRKLLSNEISWIQSGMVENHDGMKSSTKASAEYGTEADNLALGLLSLLMKSTSDFNRPLDLVCIKQDNGYSILVDRDMYAALFRAICLSGSLITGQREWHWYHTVSRRLFYPDDYIESPSCEHLISTLVRDGYMPNISSLDSTSDTLTAIVWVKRNGTLDVGDILCRLELNKVAASSRKIVVGKTLLTGNKSDGMQSKGATSVGVITSAKPYAMHSKYCSMAIVYSKLFAKSASDQKVKERLWSYSPHRGVLIPVTVKLSGSL